MRKIISLIIVSAMLIALAIPVSALQSVKYPIDTSKKVELKILFLGDKVEDQDLVYGEINKLSKKEFNTTFTIKNLSWSDYTSQYPLILASGEPLDIVYTGEWMNYFSLARKNAFREIKDADIKKYMPVTYATQPKGTFAQAMVDGKLYMIPQNQNEFNQHRLIMARGDLMAKYGMKSISNVSDFVKYCDAVVKNDKGILPIDTQAGIGDVSTIMFNQLNNIININISNIPLFGIKFKNGKFDYKNVFSIYNSPEYLAFCKLMKKWADKGYWSKNAASAKSDIHVSYQAGKSGVDIYHVGGLDGNRIKVSKDNPNFKPYIADIVPTPYAQVAKATNNGVSISNTSNNFERSLVLIDKFKNDEKYNKLSMIGISGVHYKDLPGNKYETLPSNNKYPIFGTSMWGWMNEKFRMTLNGNVSPTVSALLNKWSKQVVYPLTDNFVFDDTKVKTQMAAITNLNNIDSVILGLGMAKDVSKALSEFQAKLNKAGLKKVQDEFNRQYSAFLKANGIK